MICGGTQRRAEVALALFARPALATRALVAALDNQGSVRASFLQEMPATLLIRDSLAGEVERVLSLQRGRRRATSTRWTRSRAPAGSARAVTWRRSRPTRPPPRPP